MRVGDPIANRVARPSRENAHTPFDTELFLAGPLREPKQMLAKQEYGGHLSIHKLVAEMLLNHATLKESYAGDRGGGQE